MIDEDLKAWLAPTAAAILDEEIEQLLGWRAKHLPGRAAPAIRHAIAVLRDVYQHDDAVRAWLERRRPEFRGRSALECLQRDRLAQVDAALLRRWTLCVEGARSPSRQRPARYRRGISTSVMRWIEPSASGTSP